MTGKAGTFFAFAKFFLAFQAGDFTVFCLNTANISKKLFANNNTLIEPKLNQGEVREQ